VSGFVDENDQMIYVTHKGLNTDIDSLSEQEQLLMEIIFENGGSIRESELMREFAIRTAERKLISETEQFLEEEPDD
jgi:uncharacterized membrane protein